MEVIDIIIRSIRNDGSRFRPSDWIDRISSTVAIYHSPLAQQKTPTLSQQASTSIKARPCIIDGKKCYVVNSRLAESNPKAFNFIMQFAFSNDLNIKQNAKPVSSESNWLDFEEYHNLAFDT